MLGNLGIVLQTEHPEVLNREWLPPVLIGRWSALERLGRWLSEPLPDAGGTRAVSVRGAAGSGTSAVARRAALSVAETIRREEGGPAPRVIAVRVRWCLGAQGVATELLRQFDPGFQPQGFAVAEILAGFLRRLLRERRPAVIVLDDIGPDSPDIGLVVRALVAPLRFLPEGVDSPPRIWLLVSGASEATASWERVRRAGVPADRTVELPPYTPKEVEAIVRDRAQRALGRIPPEPWAERVAAVAAGTSASRAIDRLRRELYEPSGPVQRTLWGAPPAAPVVSVEPRLLLALEQSAANGPVTLHELKERERHLALAAGDRPLPTTTFWRRVVRLEAAGVIRREVRTGGRGGTLSRVELLRPLSERTGATSGSPRVEVRAGPGIAGAPDRPGGISRAPPEAPVPAALSAARPA